jgi:hypothetical protein
MDDTQTKEIEALAKDAVRAAFDKAIGRYVHAEPLSIEEIGAQLNSCSVAAEIFGIMNRRLAWKRGRDFPLRPIDFVLEGTSTVKVGGHKSEMRDRARDAAQGTDRIHLSLGGNAMMIVVAGATYAMTWTPEYRFLSNAMGLTEPNLKAVKSAVADFDWTMIAHDVQHMNAAIRAAASRRCREDYESHVTDAVMEEARKALAKKPQGARVKTGKPMFENIEDAVREARNVIEHGGNAAALAHVTRRVPAELRAAYRERLGR